MDAPLVIGVVSVTELHPKVLLLGAGIVRRRQRDDIVTAVTVLATARTG